MKKTKIVCTLGPASESVETMTQLIEAGMDVARINFSHGDYDQHKRIIENLREAEEITGKFIGLMLDTKGPEIRTDEVEDGQILLLVNQELRVAMKETLGTPEKISVSYPFLADEVKKGSHILIDDGLLDLEVTGFDKANNEIITRVAVGGYLGDHKGVTIPGVASQLPSLTDKDRKDIQFGLMHGINFIAPSFVRSPENVLEIREILEMEDATHVKIIPKIENYEGVQNIDEIISVSDGIMVARGDLGVDLPIEEVPLLQKELISKSNMAGKPVITATQMLDSMQNNPRPTRAETNDVANAIFDGSDAIMLSGETAVGKYPVEAVKTMYKIALRTEEANKRQSLSALKEFDKSNTTEAIGQAAGHTARNLGIETIVAATSSGYTAQMISKYRPDALIIAATPDERTARALTLVWGVKAVLQPLPDTTDEMFNLSAQTVKRAGYAEEGDLILITAGVPLGESGTTNLMKIHMIGQHLLSGQGVGSETVVARATVAKDAEEAIIHMEEGHILVVPQTDKEYLPAIQKAKGLIVEEGGLTSHAAVISIAMNLPVIVGADQATDIIKDNMTITMDTRRGRVYRGETSSI